ncbi:MAG: hypothetical protein M3277_11725 [Actinomycetota bacterium]|nr:hypothetical protein [Actinomycetota bacterium]
MKRLIAASLVLGLMFGAVATAEAAKKKKKKPAPVRIERVVEGTYDNPAPGVGGVVTLNGAGGTFDAPSGPGEYYMSVEIIDDSGQQTYFGIAADSTIIGGGCGKTETPFEITPGVAYNITVTMGPGLKAPSCAGVATTGTIKVTFSNTP